MKSVLSAARWFAYCLLAVIGLLLPVVLIQGAPGEMASLLCWAGGVMLGTAWWRRKS